MDDMDNTDYIRNNMVHNIFHNTEDIYNNHNSHNIYCDNRGRVSDSTFGSPV